MVDMDIVDMDIVDMDIVDMDKQGLGPRGSRVDCHFFHHFLKKKQDDIGVLKLKYLSLYLQFGGKEMALAGFHCQL